MTSDCICPEVQPHGSNPDRALAGAITSSLDDLGTNARLPALSWSWLSGTGRLEGRAGAEYAEEVVGAVLERWADYFHLDEDPRPYSPGIRLLRGRVAGIPCRCLRERGAVMNETALEKLVGPRTAPDGSRFPWGPITQTHEVGPYQILEYRDDRSRYPLTQQDGHGRTLFQPWVNGKSTSTSWHSLDAALAGAIAYKAEGPNGQAAHYFLRMIGAELSDE